MFCGVSWDPTKEAQEKKIFKAQYLDLLYNSLNETKLLMLDGNTPAEFQLDDPSDPNTPCKEIYISFTTKKQMKVVFHVAAFAEYVRKNNEVVTRPIPYRPIGTPPIMIEFNKFYLIPLEQPYKMAYVSKTESFVNPPNCVVSEDFGTIRRCTVSKNELVFFSVRNVITKSIVFDTRMHCNLDLFATRPHSLNFETVDAKVDAEDDDKDDDEEETVLFANEIAKYDKVML